MSTPPGFASTAGATIATEPSPSPTVTASTSTSSSTVTAYLGLGSNIGDRREVLRRAVGALDEVTVVSPVYETDPVGGVAQEAFYNIVVELETRLDPHQLLARGLELEQDEGRVRTVRWGPRTLDVDVLLYGDRRIDTAELVIPHPRMHERNFVMVPLLDIDPGLAEHRLLADYDPAMAMGEVRKVGPL